MSQPPLNYAIRKTDGQLSGNIGWLFTILWLHCDQLLRCYPSDELLMTETGIRSSATIQKHRNELINRKAIILVPVENRKGNNENSLPKNKYVYQLTGIMQLPDGKVIPTVHFTTPQEIERHTETLDELGFDVALIDEASNIDLPLKIKASNPDVPLKIKGNYPLKIEDEVIQGQSNPNLTTPRPGPPLPPVHKKTKEPSESSALDEMIESLRQIKAYGKTARRVAKTLLNLHDEDVKNVGRKPFTPQDIALFVVWWKDKYPDATVPRNMDSCIKWFNIWRDEQNETPPEQAFHFIIDEEADKAVAEQERKLIEYFMSLSTAAEPGKE